MKKVLLLSLGLAMGFGAFAQNTVVRADCKLHKVTVTKGAAIGTEVVNTTSTFAPQSKQSVVNNRYQNFEESETMHSTYDLQSNSYLSNRMYQMDNGSVGVVSTFSMAEDAAASDRGTGYNFYDGSSWGDMPEARLESIRTGWPSLAKYGATGEIIVNHSTGLNAYYREVAGQGEWLQFPVAIPNPSGLEGQTLDFNLSWPRVITSGENNEIVHVFSAAQTASGDSNVTGHFYSRFDGETWTTQWSPLVVDNDHVDGPFSADEYSAASNGDVVAVMYVGSAMGHAVVYKSLDNGLTWEKHLVWENPYADYDWETDQESIFEGLYAPAQGSITIDNDGVVHAAISIGLYDHAELGLSWSIYYGLTPDGVAYWNDTYGGPLEPMIEGDPHSALQVWHPSPDDPEMIQHCLDTVRFCGWLPPHPEAWWSEFTYESLFTGSVTEGTAGDYLSMFGGMSAFPSISVDPAGNLAMAYSAPDMTRMYDNFYMRTVYVSYKPADAEGWYVAADHAFEDFLHSYDEGTCVTAVPNVVNENEFWFSYFADDTPGFFQGTAGSQSSPSESIVYAFKVSSDFMEVSVDEQIAKDVVYNVYPNPASEYVFVASSMNADATVSFTNLAGQTVKVVNTNLTTGENSISINDLNSGVYFCTVTANGYSHTTKVVVK